MKTAVLVDSGFAGSSRQTVPLFLEPARKTHRAVTREARTAGSGQARKPKPVVVPFSVSKPELEAPDARILVPKPIVLEWVEFGFTMVLLASGFTLILLSVAAAGSI
ncbi:MAG TPA: hypothetical protein VN939_05790 [Chthoniobacterales bacterium]|nr:hypothetical protein [Chthoniobacterales bacterium]